MAPKPRGPCLSHLASRAWSLGWQGGGRGQPRRAGVRQQRPPSGPRGVSEPARSALPSAGSPGGEPSWQDTHRHLLPNSKTPERLLRHVETSARGQRTAPKRRRRPVMRRAEPPLGAAEGSPLLTARAHKRG